MSATQAHSVCPTLTYTVVQNHLYDQTDTLILSISCGLAHIAAEH